MTIRPAAVAGSWYPGNPAALIHDLDRYLAAVPPGPRGEVRAVIAPHAGLIYSGPIGAHAYKLAAAHEFEVAVLAGPSHYSAFEGVAIWPEGAFATPLGDAPIDRTGAQALLKFPVVQALPAPHRREHSLEMQLPFLRHLLPAVPIVPLVMGLQTRETIEALAQAIAAAFRGRRALLVASTDLSHYFDARRAATLDGAVQDAVATFDTEALLRNFEQYPEHERGRYVACGGGPAIAVMKAAKALGARDGRVLRYGHSGEVSGDNEAVVGYLAAAFGTFDDAH